MLYAFHLQVGKEDNVWIVVTYDVSTETAEGRRRLHRIAKVCQGYGQRVQKSVFECSVSQLQYEQMQRRALKCINEKEDSLRFYLIPEPRDRHVEEFGCCQVIDFDEPLVV